MRKIEHNQFSLRPNFIGVRNYQLIDVVCNDYSDFPVDRNIEAYTGHWKIKYK